MAAAPAGARTAHRPTELPVGFSRGPDLPDGFVPRWNFAYAYFPPADQVVIFGGAPTDRTLPWLNDTWVFTPSAGWLQGPPAPAGLTERGGAAMAFDPDIGKLVLFGGEARQPDGSEVWPPYTNETWLWDGSTWTPGPAAPPGLEPRTGGQMVYDDAIDRLVLFGGSGLDAFTDTWLFDGTQWTQGPDAPLDMPGRLAFGMAYDPLVQKVIVGGGDGASDVWLFDGTSWTRGPDFPSTMVNDARERTRMAWDPKIGAIELFAGAGPAWISDNIYYLRLASQNPTWTLMPADPHPGGPYSPPPGRLDGAIVYVPTLDAMTFFSGIDGSNEGRVGLKDLWYLHDAPPVPGTVTVSPSSPFQTQGLDVSVSGIQGGYYSTTAAFRWTRNGFVLQGQIGSHLDPQYKPGDVIRAQVRLTDALGLTGPWVSSNAVTVAKAQLTLSDGQPGGAITASGVGFAANETVDVRLDSPTGVPLGTATADATGTFSDQDLTLPEPLAGGTHQAYGTGLSNGAVSDPGPFSVHPGGATLEPADLAANQSTTFSAYGFLPGEQVSVSFPGQTPVSGPADEMGTFVVGLISPAEPAPGGEVTAVATSGTTHAHFTTIAVLSVTGTPTPRNIPVSVTGFGAQEPVSVTVDGSNGTVLQTDANGSASGVISRSSVLFGAHTLMGTGATSGVTASTSVEIPATMQLRPSSGPVGTVVKIRSGPGWGAAATVQFWVNGHRYTNYTADAQGAVNEQITIPSLPPGIVQMVLYGPGVQRRAQANFQVTP
jgi:hypothetical protein